MPAQLFALDPGPSILLDKPILLLGRHPECDIQIDSRKISRRHCCIAQVSDYLVVRDLGSTNGIRINGVRILEGRLSSGDELTIGNNRYKVVWDGKSGSPAPAEAIPKQLLRESAPPAGFVDNLLESSDEPIPLDEPSPHPDRAPPCDDDPVLPDKLELMPNSGLFPGPLPHPSSSDSHHPG